MIEIIISDRLVNKMCWVRRNHFFPSDRLHRLRKMSANLYVCVVVCVVCVYVVCVCCGVCVMVCGGVCGGVYVMCGVCVCVGGVVQKY